MKYLDGHHFPQGSNPVKKLVFNKIKLSPSIQSDTIQFHLIVTSFAFTKKSRTLLNAAKFTLKSTQN